MALFETLGVGEEVRDLERCDALSHGIEVLHRTQLRAQYESWPWDATTDGSTVELCFRPSAAALDVAGMTAIDFDGFMFPFRGDIRLGSDGGVGVTGYLVQVDAATGAPPRSPPGTLILPVRDDEGRNPVAELIVGRRQVPITWTRAYVLP